AWERCSGACRRTCSLSVPTEAFSWPVVPSAITRPWSMTAIRAASWSASSRSWGGLRVGGGPRGIPPTVVGAGAPVGELVGLVQVLGGEQNGRALSDDRA